MSEQEETSKDSEDLINLDVSLPLLQQPSQDSSQVECNLVTDNLLDTELPILERKLQKSIDDTIIKAPQHEELDVDEILISLDDDLNKFPGHYRSSSVDIIKVDAKRNNLKKSSSCDNFEEFKILNDLDNYIIEKSPENIPRNVTGDCIQLDSLKRNDNKELKDDFSIKVSDKINNKDDSTEDSSKETLKIQINTENTESNLNFNNDENLDLLQTDTGSRNKNDSEDFQNSSCIIHIRDEIDETSTQTDEFEDTYDQYNGCYRRTDGSNNSAENSPKYTNQYQPETEVDPIQQRVEDCLLDLDNYLKTYEDLTDSAEKQSSSTYSSLRDLSTPAIAEDCLSCDGDSFCLELDDDMPARKIPLDSISCKDVACYLQGTSMEEDSSLRSRLRQMEENYSRWVSLGRGVTDPQMSGRPASSCGICGGEKRRHLPARATVAVVDRRRPRIDEYLSRNASVGDDSIRTSVQPHDSDEEIDWSWVQEIARDVNSDDLQSVEGSKRLLRASMRRLHHLPIPDNLPVEESVQIRPTSAPSRLADTPGISLDGITPGRSGNHPGGGRGVGELEEGILGQSVVNGAPGRSSSASTRSRRHTRSRSSSVTSAGSSVDDTSGSCASSLTPNGERQQERRSCERNGQARQTSTSSMPDSESPLGHWPHRFSSLMACLGCSLGLFNVCRFALLTVHFGVNFVLQFLLLTLLFGLPLFTLQLCLGQQLGAGVVDMWRISPLFQGVGVALLMAQTMIGVYSIVGVSWMFVYFRDSFITKVDRYRWSEPFVNYRRDPFASDNDTRVKISETVPDYFNGVVLQRQHLASGFSYGTIKFQLAFNLAVVWMIVFVSLSKGLRSYGKVIYVFMVLPLIGIFVVCVKIMVINTQGMSNMMFLETSWPEFFLNSKSWFAAAQETFLTWGLLGAAVMQIASHNKHKNLLQRDSSLVAILTVTVLIIAAFLANKCIVILKMNGYTFAPDSFEQMSTYVFLRSPENPLPPILANTPLRYMRHNSFIVGEKVSKVGLSKLDTDFASESGYQVLRFATELVPATFAVLGSELISPFWSVLFYFTLILFGIAQQLAIWHCVITGIMAIKANLLKSWETTITFFSCTCGFLLGLPMATELGIYVVYFLDYTVGGIWWLMLVILLQILAVFMVRGRPYSGDTVVTALFTPDNYSCVLSWAPPMLSFTWNVILPVALMVLCITTFKNGNFRQIFIWHHAPAADYWPLWARQLGVLIQLVPVMCVPVVGVIQSYRYLVNGPDDILERIQLLYRPPLGEHMDDVQPSATLTTAAPPPRIIEDPPPKYTPPPSYTTATGARLAKFLRQSIRRSVRRLANALGESSSRSGGSRQVGSTSHNSQAASGVEAGRTEAPPPGYEDVLVEMDMQNVAGGIEGLPRRLSTLERLRALQPSTSVLTAAEVASILRSSFRRSTIRPGRNLQTVAFTDNSGVASLSDENLIESAAPIGETSLIIDPLQGGIDEAKSSNIGLSSSVI